MKQAFIMVENLRLRNPFFHLTTTTTLNGKIIYGFITNTILKHHLPKYYNFKVRGKDTLGIKLVVSNSAMEKVFYIYLELFIVLDL